MKTKIDDGYCRYLVEGATFTGKFQIPVLLEQQVEIPERLIPFDKRKIEDGNHQALHFFMHDVTFPQIITNANRYIEDLRKFNFVISPDCSLYRDMPLCLQITNTYFNRAVGHYLQMRGLAVVADVRWGDERSFEFCFDGVPKNSIVAISTHGCIRSDEDKHYFRMGLIALLSKLHPKTVLVHGPMPEVVFGSLLEKTQFIHFDPYLKLKKGGH